MDPSQMFGVSEECHSSESGWTMYIGSPIHGSTDADSDEDFEEQEETKTKAVFENHQDDSDDDSMASDASSGPSHQQRQRHHFRLKNPNGFKNQVSFCLESKTKKPLMVEKQREVLAGQKPKSSVQSSSKARKSIWMGKTN